MIHFKVMKTVFKNALALSKRALPKKDGKTILVGKNNELFIFTRGEGLEVFDYIPLVEMSEPFAIVIDPVPVDKWLDGKDRELKFEIKEESKKGINSLLLLNVENKKKVIIQDSESTFLEVRNNSYKPFNQQEEIIKSWYEANNMFQKSDRIYTSYASLTDINLLVFDPLFFSAYFYNEDLGIANKYGQGGIAIPQAALDTLVKTVKKPKNLGHSLTDKRFLLRDEDTVFAMNYTTEIKFPDPRSLQALDKHLFSINADIIKESLKQYPNNKVNKVKFIFDGENGIITTDNPDFPETTFPCKAELSYSAFKPAAIKAFFEGLEGDIEVSTSTFNSKTTKSGYYWKYQDKQKVKIIPGIKEAPGFN